MSVGFLHTPNFAAFWPKPRKKRILGQPPLQMSGSCPKPKKHREIERFWDNVLVSCKQFSTLPPLQMSGSCPKTEKTSRNRKILSKTKKNLEKSKKTKKTKDSGTMCWYHVNILFARLVFWFFSISRGFFRFWTKSFDFSMFFLILDGFFRILNVFLILDTFF